MGRYDDIDPGDIDPETGRPYANYSSPSLDEQERLHQHEMDVADEEDDEEESCLSPEGHSWVVRDDNEEISYCEWCGADGNA